MLTGSILMQLTIVGLLATLIFFGTYSLPQKVAGTALILLIPFQPIETRYASANTVLTFVVFIAMFMREKNISLPLLPQISAVLFTYLISMGLADPAAWTVHGLYMLNLVGAFMVFWIAYDLTFRFNSFQQIIKILLILNVLVIIYCIIQLIVGPNNKLRAFGMEEFAMMAVRDDYRLTGPFGGVGVIAEYFVIMVFVIAREIVVTDKAGLRRLLLLLVGANLVMLIATGNRGGFLTLIGASGVFLYMFRSLLGTVRTLLIAFAGAFVLGLAAAVAITYTDFDRLFERLGETELEEGGIPDTRAVVWPKAWEDIKERPIFGHGPRLNYSIDDVGPRFKGEIFGYYPHNLYLFLLVTVGISGFVAFLSFLITALVRCWRLSRERGIPADVLSFAKVGVLIMIVIFVDQIKVEFMRFVLIDYWHFVFAMLGFLVAFCDKTRLAYDLSAYRGRSPGRLVASDPAQVA